ncbi:hypothetical protein NEOLEDRAFT_1082548 [Neolentinus lepideus HHB14362 ss-1]|uniref:Uncharacterized protein n=1 Tax=Neolentinus lepideus HHB14362 ss-1 TaxID=1314782 RepID=A0A165W1C6_9AGAM|nr:hypothetical protein NEOLEDRAFT_1082548 [Neolentinus lepideus HHB14362 ss-1]
MLPRYLVAPTPALNPSVVILRISIIRLFIGFYHYGSLFISYCKIAGQWTWMFLCASEFCVVP